MKYAPTPNQKAMIDKVHNFNKAGEEDICVCCKKAIMSTYGEGGISLIGCVSRLRNLLSVYGFDEDEYVTLKKPSNRFAFFNCNEAYKDLFKKAFLKNRILKI